ncbi:MAG: CDP-diacylglycerol--glycerol-3-phosphate 3-phosphatidyltransferase [Eubacteriales bacterium]|jgi:CDP-diacylglycerol--glycerol-3-phosphate 3-phosphatidyltransferase
MNLPNKLTMARVVMIPIFLILLYVGTEPAQWAALAVFVIASLTDLLDGKIARKYNLVTDFGKFADPLADKLLVTAAFVWFVDESWMPAWICFVILAREFIVTGLRIVAIEKGRVIAAGMLGKIKTTIQMVSVVILLIPGVPETSDMLVWTLNGAMALITLWSGLDYVVKNFDLIREA